MIATIKNTTKWLQMGLIALLVIAVLVLTSMVFKMQDQLDEMKQGRQAALRDDPPVQPSDPLKRRIDSSTAPPAKKPGGRQFDVDDDWFSKPFDPNSWDPFAEMQRMQEHMNRMFNDSFGHFGASPKYRDLARDPSFSPKIDVHEDKDRFVLSLDLPGVDEGSVNVQVDGRKVTVSGERKSSSDEADSSGRMMRSERRTGKFARTVELPEPVDATKIEAKNEQGVFTIVLPKADKTEAVI